MAKAVLARLDVSANPSETPSSRRNSRHSRVDRTVTHLATCCPLVGIRVQEHGTPSTFGHFRFLRRAHLAHWPLPVGTLSQHLWLPCRLSLPPLGGSVRAAEAEGRRRFVGNLRSSQRVAESGCRSRSTGGIGGKKQLRRARKTLD